MKIKWKLFKFVYFRLRIFGDFKSEKTMGVFLLFWFDVSFAK